MTPSTHSHIAIIGTGFAGLGMAIRLRQAGIDDFVIFERANDVGGTWRDNTYPGCACDVPSHLYSFSFEPNPKWSRTFSPQPEIWAYLRRCAAEHNLGPHIRFDHEVLEATWDESNASWLIETSQGEFTANVMIFGGGPLSAPKLPDVPGIGTFEGTAFHSAQWNHEHDMSGKRVAVVGTGASTIQIVPKIQRDVGELKLFQRTPPWVMPHPDRPISGIERAVYSAAPPLQRAMRAGIYWARESFVMLFMHPRLMVLGERIARTHLRRQVRDGELRRKLTPRYRMGCKRVLLSNEYYPALCRDNVEVITEGIVEVRRHGVVTADGREHEVDTIVFGTGFHVTDLPVAEHLRGRDGALLADVWQGSPAAHLGTAIPGFPNLFLLLGPNTGLGHNSVVFMIESQIAYVIQALQAMDRRGLETLDVREDAQQRFIAEVDSRMAGSVWTTGGCASWYLDASGRNSTLWPGTSWRFRTRTQRFELGDYELTTKRPRELVASR